MTDLPPTQTRSAAAPGLSALRRSSDDRMLAGVCGGIGRHVGIDPVLIRVAVASLAVFGGVGFVVYAAGWLLIPEEGSSRTTAGRWLGRDDQQVRTIGLVAAAVVAAAVLGGGWLLPFGSPAPLIGLAIVWFLFFRHRFRPGGPVDPAVSTPPAERGTEPAAPDWSAPDPLGLYVEAPPAASEPAGQQQRAEPSALVGVTIGLALLLGGALALVDLVALDIPPATYAATGLGLVGLALLVGAWLGQARKLIPPGVLLCAALAITSVAPDLRFGEVVERPVTADQVRSDYHLTAGRIEVDLTGVRDLAALDGRSIVLGVQTGEILVSVPADLDVEISGSAFAGQINLIDEVGKGSRVETTFATPDDADPNLRLDLSVGLGQIRVVQA